jgi:hypothetical protein
MMKSKTYVEHRKTGLLPHSSRQGMAGIRDDGVAGNGPKRAGNNSIMAAFARRPSSLFSDLLGNAGDKPNSADEGCHWRNCMELHLDDAHRRDRMKRGATRGKAVSPSLIPESRAASIT